tara:strand:+ start:101 stop:394 length:294 start_codon:yes stop_codon:yes gene_type:complete
MFQAIETKYYGPTNHRGSRIRATAQCGKVWVSYDHGLNPQQNHAAAAKAFLLKWGWSGQWAGGANASQNGYVFVRVESNSDMRDGTYLHHVLDRIKE